jgi:hypothetical protein
MMNSQCTTKPALNKMIARIAKTISNSILYPSFRPR